MIAIRVYFLATMMIAFSNANGQTSELLPGRWTVDLQRTLDNLTGQQKARYDSMSISGKNALKNAFEGREFDFQEGNVLIVKVNSNGSTKALKGTWSANDNGEVTLTIGQEEQAFTAVFIAKHLQLRYKTVPDKALFKVLWLTRIDEQ